MYEAAQSQMNRAESAIRSFSKKLADHKCLAGCNPTLWVGEAQAGCNPTLWVGEAHTLKLVVVRSFQ